MTQQTPADAVDHAAMTLHQGGEGPFIAVGHEARQELPVGHTVAMGVECQAELFHGFLHVVGCHGHSLLSILLLGPFRVARRSLRVFLRRGLRARCHAQVTFQGLGSHFPSETLDYWSVAHINGVTSHGFALRPWPGLGMSWHYEQSGHQRIFSWLDNFPRVYFFLDKPVKRSVASGIDSSHRPSQRGRVAALEDSSAAQRIAWHDADTTHLTRTVGEGHGRARALHSFIILGLSLVALPLRVPTPNLDAKCRVNAGATGRTRRANSLGNGGHRGACDPPAIIPF